MKCRFTNEVQWKKIMNVPKRFHFCVIDKGKFPCHQISPPSGRSVHKQTRTIEL